MSKQFNLLGIQTEKSSTIISPIFYMGNKRKLINRGLITMFPNNISTFVDVFAGSGVVGMNVVERESSDLKIIINDIDNHLIELYNLFKTTNADTIINTIEQMIDSFGLARERTKRCFYKDIQKLAKYKQAYLDFRNYYNADKSNIIALYLLTCYSFSQLMRFNSDGNFNMPVGIDCFCEENREYIRNGCKYFSNKYLEIYNMDYAELVNQILINADSNTFFYLDPPYINTTATYNENDGWTAENQNQLYDILNRINGNNCKFALSNVAECKGIINDDLLDFAKQNNYTVHTFDNFNYTACGKGNSNAMEVLITNY